MYVYTQGHSRLISTGVYLPEQRITTRELMQEIDSENRYGLSYNWLERVTGIRESVSHHQVFYLRTWQSRQHRKRWSAHKYCRMKLMRSSTPD